LLIHKYLPRRPVLLWLTTVAGGFGKVVGQSVLGLLKETASSNVAAHYGNN
jgi:hypothetical protein